MAEIQASKFKEQCLSILDNLGPEGVIITKRGRPVAKLVPLEGPCAHLLGSMAGEIKVTDPDDDLFSTGIQWDAQS
ncbi:MAG: type II toxin-antitoxin system prevent-host-death family antitoxin [Acidobacteria bacterium]|nr:type II toxin-antitoxin system prevent-host-death family antitoxin [Acidobacteriota bacterium]